MLSVLGAGHHEVDLAQLEGLSSSADDLRGRLTAALQVPDPVLAGFVVLATCNRLEIYVDAVRFHDAVDLVIDAVAASSGLSVDHVESLVQVRVGSSVGAHLFSVAAGLDAMVVGEAEISGQVGRSYRAAEDSGTVSPALHALFRTAARTAKAVSRSTRLGAEGRSVASVALQLAAGRGSLAGRSALVVGTGAMARVVVAALRSLDCTEVSVFSPSGRAVDFAASHEILAVNSDELVQRLESVDLVVAASGTAASSGAIGATAVQTALAARNTPVTIVDLALHRDIPDSIRALSCVTVIDLHTVADAAGPAHGAELRAAQEIVLGAATAFEDELVGRSLDPAVVALRSHVYAAVDTELKRLRRKYSLGMSDQIADDVERAMLRVTNTLLHTPTVRAKELAKDGSGEDYVKALHTLFGIEIPRH